MKRFISVITAIVMALCFASCAREKLPPSIDSYYADVNRNFGGDIISGSMGKRINGDVKIITEERAELINLAVKDIRINNSRFALPLYVKDVPENFSVTYGEKLVDIENFYFYQGSLESEGNAAAKVFILRHKSLEDENGVIVAALLSSDNCKWSIGPAESSEKDELIKCFGEPSSEDHMTGFDSVDISYFNDNGDFLLFFGGVNSVMAFALDCTRISDNGSLCEYVPYDDFGDMAPFEDMTADKLDFTLDSVMNEKSVRIGDFSCRPDISVSELKKDMILSYLMSEEWYADGYTSDRYTLIYKGRSVGAVNAVRKNEEQMTDAVIAGWYFSPAEELPCPVSIAGIPCAQRFESVREAISQVGFERDDGSIWVYDGDDERFVKFSRYTDGMSVLNAELFLGGE